MGARRVLGLGYARRVLGLGYDPTISKISRSCKTLTLAMSRCSPTFSAAIHVLPHIQCRSTICGTHAVNRSCCQRHWGNYHPRSCRARKL